MPLIEDEEQLDEAMKGGSGGPILRLTEDHNTVTVRFLQEPITWAYTDSYFNKKENRSIQLEEGQRAPRGRKVRRHFYANALDIDHDTVVVVVMAKTLADRLYQRYLKRETLLDRDYELARVGSGLQTKYQESPESPMKRNLKKYAGDMHDLLDVIDDIFGDKDDDDDEDYEEDEYDDEEEEEKPRRRTVKKPGAKAAKRPAKKTTKRPAKKTTKKVAKKAARRRARR